MTAIVSFELTTIYGSKFLNLMVLEMPQYKKGETMQKKNPLTVASVASYNKLLSPMLDKPIFEVFLEIGLDLIELEPKQMYINTLVQQIADSGSLSMNDLNMMVMQLQNFYNDTIATYDSIELDDSEEKSFIELEEAVTFMMSQQDDKQNKKILIDVLDNAIVTVAREYNFYNELFNIVSYDELLRYLKDVVFEEYPSLYVAFIPMMDMAQMLKKGAEANEYHAFALLTMLNLAMFNNVRKARHSEVVSQVVTSTKIGRNEPCPCGSGKKYKKCCGKS